MTTTGDVEMTVLDGGAGVVVVPAESVQVVIGPCSGGVVAQCVPTRDPNTLQSVAGTGPAVDAAANSIAAGGTAIFMKSATTTPGAVIAGAAKVITAVSNAAVITSVAHGLKTGDVVAVAAVVGAVEVNVTKKITRLTADTFTLDGITVASAYVSGGTATWSGVNLQGAGTSVISVTGTPYDAYLVKGIVTKAGTVGTTGIRFKLSVDAGRTFGPELALGTANTYPIAGTGLTLAFGAGTVLADESFLFACTEPLSDAASVQACLVALEASPFSVSGWGSMLIVGARTGSEAAQIEGFMDTLVVTKTFARAMFCARDASLPVAWGGTGEDDPTWSAAIALDYSAVSAKRVLSAGGYYNIPSQYPIPAAGLPIMRRPGVWALAARRVTLQPQTHAGRVSDGALAQIITDPTNDPNDGFIYHDDAQTAFALDVARFCAFRKRKGKPGWFVVNPNLMSPPGSVYTLLPLGDVMDIGCALLHQTGEDEINADVRLNDNGTIDENAAQAIESVNRGVLRDQMLAPNMISNYSYVIDRTVNVRATKTVKFTAQLFSRGYILQINGSIGFGNTAGG